MKDSGCLARSALRTDLHLACTAGPDVGLVLAPGTVGRAGEVPLSCASVAREHVLFSTNGGRAVLEPAPTSPPFRVRTRLGRWRTHRTRQALTPGTRLSLGEDVFEVRPRPLRLAWPGVERRGRGSLTGASLLRGAPLLSVLVMVAFMGWRLRAAASAPRVLVALAAASVVLLCGFVIAFSWRIRRRRRGWDGAALALVLAGLPNSASPPRSIRASVWPGRATSMRRRVLLSTAVDEPGQCATIGIAGAHAPQCALWCAGQVAAQVGGARVWWNSSAPVLLGHAGVDIHVSGADCCPYCARGTDSERPTVHIGYASTVARLPAWCAQVCITDDAPVASQWWWTVTRADAQDTLPSRVGWDPNRARGSSGVLGVRIGMSPSGPVELDLVSDGPHALVAGCTGSGKSEALIGWLASIAHCYSPDKVRFVLIDYKGGSTFARLQGLPHTHALLTDLDPGATTRALEGIAAELQRREEQLSALSFPDLASWERAHSDAPASVPRAPARLVVAIDEFRVLAQTHPDSMDILLRLAAQGRSLGLHLIAATQRPSGAVSAQMRANMDIRLALRCVSAADSTDILGDARAASLPRIPGRAVLDGTGTIQLAYMEDVASVVSQCAYAWPHSGVAALWAPALPQAITWEEVDSASASPVHAPNLAPGGPRMAGESLTLGLTEGIDEHAPIVWDGGSIQIQASAHEAALASRWVLSLATRIAQQRGYPLHVIGEEDVPGCASHLHPEDACVIDLLEGIREHGPAILAITDVPTLRVALTQSLSAPQAESLWTALLGGARRAGVTIVAAYAGRFTASSATMGAFSTRLVRARDADEALHAGISPTDLRTLAPGQALLARPGERTALVCVPDTPCHLDTPVRSATSGWGIPSPATASSLVRNAVAPALIGPTYDEPRWEQPLPWIIIGTQEDETIIKALHAYLGWETPTITDVIPDSAWTRIVRWDGHRVLAMNPTNNVIRALIQHCHASPLSILARRWDPTCGLICEGDTLTTVQLTVGSVNT